MRAHTLERARRVGNWELRSWEWSWHHLTHSLSEKELTRMAKQAVATRTDLDPIDRLEEKVKLLVSVVAQLRREHAKAIDDNSRLLRDVDSLRARLSETEVSGTELSALREERDIVRARVAEMLEQLESI